MWAKWSTDLPCALPVTTVAVWSGVQFTKGAIMSRTKLLEALDAAAQAHLDYLESRITYRAYSRALDHVAVCRDAAGLDFFRIVRLPERAAEVVS